VVWKNGVRHLEFPKPASSDGRLLDAGDSRLVSKPLLFVYGEDVYIFAREDENCVVWKNGTRHLEMKAYDNNDNHYVAPVFESLFVSGEDVYLAGTVFEFLEHIEPRDGSLYTQVLDRYPVLCKNGETAILPQYKHEFLPTATVVNAVCVQGDDVYVVGSDGNALLWKNGVQQKLPFVAPK
jgi:hypothetical protein